MEALDFYSLLNLPRHESPAGLAAAHRDFLRQVDRSFGWFWPPERVSAFEHAFEVLSREASRHAYDAGLYAQAVPAIDASHGSAESILADAANVHPSVQALRERLARNYTGIGVPKGEHRESLTIEVPVTPEDIERQQTISIGIPTFEGCSMCNGTGRVALFECTACAGQGSVEETRVIRHVLGREGIVECSLDELGIRNCFLRVHLRVTHA